MYFIQADGRALFEYDTQVKILSGMDEPNKKLLQKFFPSNDDTDNKKSLFDVIDCQFAMHYMFENKNTFYNCLCLINIIPT